MCWFTKGPPSPMIVENQPTLNYLKYLYKNLTSNHMNIQFYLLNCHPTIHSINILNDVTQKDFFEKDTIWYLNNIKKKFNKRVPFLLQ